MKLALIDEDRHGEVEIAVDIADVPRAVVAEDASTPLLWNAYIAAIKGAAEWAEAVIAAKT
jgi:hypothetical protein